MYIINFEALNGLLTLKSDQPNIVETEIEETFDAQGSIQKTVKRVKTIPKPLEYDTVKYDMIYQLLLTYLNNDTQLDLSLGIDRALKEAPIEWQTAYKTLLEYNILVESETE